MTTNTGSATIYQFPPRGRFAIDHRCEDARAAGNSVSQYAAQAACGSAWYHEEAIQEAERSRN